MEGNSDIKGELQKPTLLLVDDDHTFSLVLSQALARRGFEVHVANDVEAGVNPLILNMPSSTCALARSRGFCWLNGYTKSTRIPGS